MDKDVCYLIISYFEDLSFRLVCKEWGKASIPKKVIEKQQERKNIRKVPIRSPFINNFIDILPYNFKQCALFSLDDPDSFPLLSLNWIREYHGGNRNFKIFEPLELIWNFEAKNYYHSLNPGMRNRFIEYLCKMLHEFNDHSIVYLLKYNHKQLTLDQVRDKFKFFITEIISKPKGKYYFGSCLENVTFLDIFPELWDMVEDCLEYIDMDVGKVKYFMRKGEKGVKIIEKYCDMGFPSKNNFPLYNNTLFGCDSTEKKLLMGVVFIYLRRFPSEFDKNAFLEHFEEEIDKYEGEIPEDIKCYMKKYEKWCEL